MSQTYQQLKKHIAELQVQAEDVKRSEVAGVIAKAKEAIRVYGLTRQDLFDGKGASASKASRPARAAKGPNGRQVKSTEPKYADGKGGFWVGRGKRPQWLSDLLKAGAKLEDFLTSPVPMSAAGQAPDESAAAPAAAESPGVAPAAKKRNSVKPAARTAPAKPIAKQTVRAKYQDGAGNSWSGFGPRPKWLKDAIAGGKQLEDLQG
jgi:DNA-binding protein H-NS